MQEFQYDVRVEARNNNNNNNNIMINSKSDNHYLSIFYHR